jgi:hypothetical protein
MCRRKGILANRAILGVLVLFGACAVGCQPVHPQAGVGVKDPPQVGPESTAPLTGTLSCSGRGCHADFERPDLKDQPVYRISYTRWLHRDPHTRAYKVLYEPLAVEMGKKLGIKDVGTEPRCLVCHCTPQAAESETIAARDEREWGVGCEACHGPAKNWLVAHRDASWQKMTPDQKQKEYDKVGMSFLQSHVVRAEVCAGCHVGAPADPARGIPARDMNHDFIAAGHPRLMFEYGSFLANLPKHWTEKDTRFNKWTSEKSDFEARVWLVGQAVSARSALRLLADHRANPKAKDAVWPELAEFDCYACHHDLADKSWRQERGFPDGPPGATRPNQWYTALLPEVTAMLPGGPALRLDALKKSLHRQSPDEADVVEKAQAVLTAMNQVPVVLENREYNREAIKGLREQLVAIVNGTKRTDWDQVEQCALGLRALDLADRALRKKADQKPTPEDEETTRTIDDLLKLLAFPSGMDSPHDFRRTEDDQKKLKVLFSRLKQG